MEKVFGGKLFSLEIKPIFRKPEVTSGKEKSESTAVKVALQAVIRENYRTFRSYGIMWNPELRPFRAILSVTAIGWKMKDESVIKNTARIPRFGNLDIKNCYRIRGMINGEMPRKVGAVCEYDSGPITAARRKLKIEGANKPETRYFGFYGDFYREDIISV